MTKLGRQNFRLNNEVAKLKLQKAKEKLRQATVDAVREQANARIKDILELEERLIVEIKRRQKNRLSGSRPNSKASDNRSNNFRIRAIFRQQSSNRQKSFSKQHRERPRPQKHEQQRLRKPKIQQTKLTGDSSTS